MKNKRTRVLTAALLVLCLLLTLPLIPAGMVQAVDTTKECSLTIKNPQNEDLQTVDVRIDLYKVADAEADGTYDTYGYQATEDYQTLQEILIKAESLDNEGWQKLAQDAAALTLEPAGKAPKATAEDIPVGTEIKGLEAGLYLVIARGAGISDYAERNAEGQLVTKAYSDKNIYTYLPELVSLPSTTDVLNGELDADGNRQPVNTSDGEWKYALTAVLKPAQAPRFAPVTIQKTLLRYEDSEPATFIFQVDVYKNRDKTELLSSDVITFTFDGPGEKQLVLSDQIPVGAYVVVTEVYSGTAYTPQGDRVQEAEILVEGMEFSFVNDYDGTNNSGGSIVNHFERTDGSWDWEQLRDNLEE